MNPIVMFSSVLGSLLGLRRTCPKCRRAQVVPPSKKRERVRCKFCGAQIPPS